MPRSCKCILDTMVHNGAMTEKERDKILRNLKTVIVIQLDVLMNPNTIDRFRDDMLKQMKDGLVVIPGFAHLAYVGEGCDIQIVEKGE